MNHRLLNHSGFIQDSRYVKVHKEKALFTPLTSYDLPPSTKSFLPFLLFVLFYKKKMYCWHLILKITISTLYNSGFHFLLERLRANEDFHDL